MEVIHLKLMNLYHINLKSKKNNNKNCKNPSKNKSIKCMMIITIKVHIIVDLVLL